MSRQAVIRRHHYDEKLEEDPRTEAEIRRSVRLTLVQKAKTIVQTGSLRW